VSEPRPYFLTTDRLGFSEWYEDDLPLAMILWGDPKVSALIGGPFADEDVRARLASHIEMLHAHQVQYWPIFLLQDGDFVGCAGLRPYGNGEPPFELGFHLRPAYWRQGLAMEAAQAVIAFAFETLAVKTLFAGHHPENGASERLLRKLGFRFSHQEFYPPTGLLEPAYLLANPKAP
jgi:[ribosomal protein S5]-alanine N-acetyltransferase